MSKETEQQKENTLETDYVIDVSESEYETENDFSQESFLKAEAIGAEEAVEAVQKSSWWKELYEWTQALAFAVVIALLINQFLFAIVQVEGKSMLPTLHDKERLVVTKLLYKPKQKDIVIIKSSVLGKNIVKRVIALPGQEVDIDSVTGDVYVDGVLQEEAYIQDKISPSRVGTKYEYPFVVPENTVFVMGDNRNNSQDSRAIGVVPYHEIIGKAAFRIMPLNKFGGLYHEVNQTDR